MRPLPRILFVAVLILLGACSTPASEVTAGPPIEGPGLDEARRIDAITAQNQLVDQAAVETKALADLGPWIEKTAEQERIKARAVARASRSATNPRPRPTVVITGDIWGALARCESGGNPRSIGGGGRYFGAFQFTLGTWHSLGYAGNPIDYPYGTQLEAAQRLQARSGWGQWPHCARKLGLR